MKGNPMKKPILGLLLFTKIFSMEEAYLKPEQIILSTNKEKTHLFTHTPYKVFDHENKDMMSEFSFYIKKNRKNENNSYLITKEGSSYSTAKKIEFLDNLSKNSLKFSVKRQYKSDGDFTFIPTYHFDIMYTDIKAESCLSQNLSKISSYNNAPTYKQHEITKSVQKTSEETYNMGNVMMRSWDVGQDNTINQSFNKGQSSSHTQNTGQQYSQTNNSEERKNQGTHDSESKTQTHSTVQGSSNTRTKEDHWDVSVTAGLNTPGIIGGINFSATASKGGSSSKSNTTHQQEENGTQNNRSQGSHQDRTNTTGQSQQASITQNNGQETSESQSSSQGRVARNTIALGENQSNSYDLNFKSILSTSDTHKISINISPFHYLEEQKNDAQSQVPFKCTKIVTATVDALPRKFQKTIESTMHRPATNAELLSLHNMGMFGKYSEQPFLTNNTLSINDTGKMSFTSINTNTTMKAFPFTNEDDSRSTVGNEIFIHLINKNKFHLKQKKDELNQDAYNYYKSSILEHMFVQGLNLAPFVEFFESIE